MNALLGLTAPRRLSVVRPQGTAPELKFAAACFVSLLLLLLIWLGRGGAVGKILMSIALLAIVAFLYRLFAKPKLDPVYGKILRARIPEAVWKDRMLRDFTLSDKQKAALDEAMLARIHARLLLVAREFGGDIARIVFCASADAAHPWRKPNPGMLLDQAAFFGVALAGVPFVGDSLADIEAARAAGAVPVLVKTGNGRAVAHKWRGKLDDVAVYANVESAVDCWLKEAA